MRFLRRLETPGRPFYRCLWQRKAKCLIKKTSAAFSVQKWVVLFFFNKFDYDGLLQCAPIQKCHWPDNDSFRGLTPCGDKHLYKSVIDQSMTVFGGSTPCGDVHLYKIVIDRSMTILKQPSKNVIDRSMTVLEGSTPCGDVHLYKIVIDWSMTIWILLGLAYHR